MKKQLALIVPYIISIVILVSLTYAYEEGYHNSVTRRVVIISVVLILTTLILAVILLIGHNQQLKENNKKLYESAKRDMAYRTKAQTLRKRLEEQIEELKKEIEQHHEESDKPKYEGSNLKKHTQDELMVKIITFLDNSDEIFNHQFSLKQLADKVGSNYKYVSQTINESLNMNFTALLNEYRIKEACRRMGDSNTYGNQTIEAIGESVGFKSRTTFISSFKRIIGMTPSEFQRQSNQNFQA